MTVTKPAKADKGSWRAQRGAVEAVVEGRHGDPFAVLGMQGGDGSPLVVRVFHPTAGRVQVLDGALVVADLERTDEAGFYEGAVAGRASRFPYRLRLGIGGREARGLAELPFRGGKIAADGSGIAQGKVRGGSDRRRR
jgi:hypothetical protein